MNKNKEALDNLAQYIKINPEDLELKAQVIFRTVRLICLMLRLYAVLRTHRTKLDPFQQT